MWMSKNESNEKDPESEKNVCVMGNAMASSWFGTSLRRALDKRGGS
jgi:hypothetical protein